MMALVVLFVNSLAVAAETGAAATTSAAADNPYSGQPTQHTEPVCCSSKTVGGLLYNLTSQDDNSAFDCLNSCRYEREDEKAENIYCFAAGTLKVVCHDRGTNCTPSESIYGSVGFSIDNTGSVGSSATGVMSLSNGIIDKIVELGFTIPRWVLTTFSDGEPYAVDHPDNTDLRIVTDSVTSFQDSLNTISFSGGGDGPERATQGILLTLQNLPMYGVALVFTDYQTKDVGLLTEIIALRNQKRIKIFIALAPAYCCVIGDESWLAYDEISEGRIYNMADFTKEEFITEVVVTIGKDCEL